LVWRLGAVVNRLVVGVVTEQDSQSVNPILGVEVKMHDRVDFLSPLPRELGGPNAEGVVRLDATRPTAAPLVVVAVPELPIEVELGRQPAPRRLRPDATQRRPEFDASLQFEAWQARVDLD
jgi:hypothetical protein